MSLTEDQGCELLDRVFTGRGYRIVRNFPFVEGDVTFEADGWDPEARVGFEYLTRESGDHDDMTREEYERLAVKMNRGDLYFFIIDEGEVEDEGELVDAANRFLDEVAARRAGVTPVAKKAAAKKPAAKKAAAKKPAAKKAAAKKAAAKKKPAAKKPAKKKRGARR